ncbi:MAG TPA: 30S ribosomal protein S8 [Planctomycetes bacterium]|nr:30S ribosomal protein S8 [Planctomycetota bacterium]
MTDPVADMLTRIRNGLRARKKTVDVPASRIKVDIAEILKQEGFIEDYQVFPLDGPKADLRITLKYGPDGEQVITEIKRESKPGRRVYVGVHEIPKVRNGLGIAILTTPIGVVSDRVAREKHVGGELLCSVW